MTDTSVLVVAYMDVLFVGGFVTMAQNARTAFDGSDIVGSTNRHGRMGDDDQIAIAGR